MGERSFTRPCPPPHAPALPSSDCPEFSSLVPGASSVDPTLEEGSSVSQVGEAAQSDFSATNRTRRMSCHSVVAPGAWLCPLPPRWEVHRLSSAWTPTPGRRLLFLAAGRVPAAGAGSEVRQVHASPCVGDDEAMEGSHAPGVLSSCTGMLPTSGSFL